MMYFCMNQTPFEQIYWMQQFGIQYEQFVPFKERQAIHKFFYILDWCGVSSPHSFEDGYEGPFSPGLAEVLPYYHTIPLYHLKHIEYSITQSQLEHLILPPDCMDICDWVRALGAFLFYYERYDSGVEKGIELVKQKITLDNWKTVEKALKNRLFYIRMQA